MVFRYRVAVGRWKRITKNRRQYYPAIIGLGFCATRITIKRLLRGQIGFCIWCNVGCIVSIRCTRLTNGVVDENSDRFSAWPLGHLGLRAHLPGGPPCLSLVDATIDSRESK